MKDYSILQCSVFGTNNLWWQLVLDRGTFRDKGVDFPCLRFTGALCLACLQDCNLQELEPH